MKYVTHLITIIATLVTVSLLSFAWLGHAASNHFNENVERARVSNILESTKNRTEANLSIGLPLDQISVLQDIVEREKSNDPAVLAIDIYDKAGRLFYSSDRSAIGQPVPAEWTRKMSIDAVAASESIGDPTYRSTFYNDLGVAGGVAVTIAESARSERITELEFQLLKRASFLVLAAVGLASIAAFVFALWLIRPFNRVAQILDGTRAGNKADWLEAQAIHCRQTWKSAQVHLDKAFAGLRALDDQA